MEDAMANIKKSANQVRTRLKKIELANQDLTDTDAESRIRKTQHMTLSRQFVEYMTEYNQLQNEYRDKSKGKIQRQMELAGSNVTEEELENLLESGKGAQLVGHVVIEGDEEQLKQTINDLENRHEMFLNLEKSISELHDMFIDIAMLIENQGEMVNRIDNHVESAVEYTSRATNDTKKALEYQSKARRKKIMMLLCMIIVGGLGGWFLLKKMEIL
ncbi:Uncharacterized protein FKW44_024429 [Caligus rogercresseyi]|uniref:t-SNARE coiled-coil homology domain-containing protein n=1 Tax=Caligus rogercresseyi TaxID=217165 RepID=A0A7T8JT32_CALRO|nr:Uncharacterized protein FKW44_024810 [Caligus rogercresseyi]QQP33148.1 Uncharacterized protein FKW44_024429 [Caligus rogercresseyi]